MEKGKILLVDDEADILEVLGEFLEDKGFSVTTAHDGVDALEVLGRDSRFDLLLSDINMPRMKGFELIRVVKEKYPGIKTALITTYDVNSYIELALKHNVGNIIAKTSPFNFNDFLVNVSTLVSGDIFGLDKYFTGAQNEAAFTIRHSRDIEETIKDLMAFLTGHPRTDRIKTALRELIVNAVYYGARDEDGARKDEWQMNVELVPDEYVTVRCLKDGEKAGMGIIDQKGRLKKADVLYWLERNITRDPVTGLVKSLEDEHGRGLFISREFIDSLIINIRPGVKTEIILLSYFVDKYKGFKPLIINEI